MVAEVKSRTENGVRMFEAEINGEKIEWDDALTYSTHLRTHQLLSAQVPVSDKPDEMLFIIIHQTMELWIKLNLHEARIAMDLIRRDELPKAYKTLDRMGAILRHMISSWEILATLTPHDFLTFRGYLRKGSGFQSAQYRELEFTLGNKNADLILVHQDDAEVHEQLSKVLNAPSIYDETLKLLSARGFKVPAEALERDWATPYAPHPDIETIWHEIYSDVDRHWDLYMLGEKLTALEYYFQEWRFKHMKTVSRVIGNKRGTGGSAGVSYLTKALSLSFFPELWTMRTDMVAPVMGPSGRYETPE